MKCHTCGGEDTRLAMVARAKGFTSGFHCAINANAFGKVSRCFGDGGLCEFCTFYLAVTEMRPEGIGGRMRRMIKKELVK